MYTLALAVCLRVCKTVCDYLFMRIMSRRVVVYQLYVECSFMRFCRSVRLCLSFSAISSVSPYVRLLVRVFVCEFVCELLSERMSVS